MVFIFREGVGDCHLLFVRINGRMKVRIQFNFIQRNISDETSTIRFN